MVKFYCDGCDVEITERNKATGGTIAPGRLGTEVKSRNGKHRLKVELLTSADGSANDGLFCKYCVIDAFKDLDDRPRPARMVS